MNATRRVTYDPRGVAIIRLRDQSEDSTYDPVGEYLNVKAMNQTFFKDMSRATSLDEKLKIATRPVTSQTM